MSRPRRSFGSVHSTASTLPPAGWRETGDQWGKLPGKHQQLHERPGRKGRGRPDQHADESPIAQHTRGVCCALDTALETASTRPIYNSLEDTASSSGAPPPAQAGEISESLIPTSSRRSGSRSVITTRRICPRAARLSRDFTKPLIRALGWETMKWRRAITGSGVSRHVTNDCPVETARLPFRSYGHASVPNEHTSPP